MTRPVAAADYWLSSKLKAFIGRSVFHAVLIERDPKTRVGNPAQQMANTLAAGDSLILFPEGTRNMTEAETHAREMGVTTLMLDTNSALPEAAGLYQRLGWTEIDRFNDDPYPDLFFEKRV